MGEYQEAFKRLNTIDLDVVNGETKLDQSIYGIHDYANLELSKDLSTIQEAVIKAQLYDEQLKQVLPFPIEDLNCSIKVLLEVLKGCPIYRNKFPYMISNYYIHTNNGKPFIETLGGGVIEYFKDYGKTWWIKKEDVVYDN